VFNISFGIALVDRESDLCIGIVLVDLGTNIRIGVAVIGLESDILETVIVGWGSDWLLVGGTVASDCGSDLLLKEA